MLALSELLPHRWPMLLLDEVLAVEPGLGLIGRYAVASGDPWCGPEGLPPYLVLESWLQACAALLRWDQSTGSEQSPELAAEVDIVVGSLQDARVTRPLHPGETVEHRASVIRRVAGTALLAGSSTVSSEPVLFVGQATIILIRRG